MTAPPMPICGCYFQRLFGLSTYTATRISVGQPLPLTEFFRLDISGGKAHKKSSRKWRRTWRFKGNLLHVKNC